MPDQVAVMLTVAPNGARRGRRDHPAIPLTPGEIAEEARLCERAGAAILHLHVRDAGEGHSLDPGRYREAMAAVREVSSAVIQPTTERVGRFAPADMMRVQRELSPEMISLNLDELQGERTPNEVAAARQFLAEVCAQGTIPQYLVFSERMLAELAAGWREGWVPQKRPYVLLVLGRYGANPGSTNDLLGYLPRIPGEWTWGVCSFGAAELPVNVLAALTGGHCRVGFENNLEREPGAPLARNSEQVGRLTGLLAQMSFPVATPAQVRRYFGLPGP